MKTLLHHNVPRFIKHIRERGGVNDEEMRWMHSYEDSPDYPEAMLARADEYLLYPKNEETFNKGLFVLVKMLAIMSFISGGIRVFGLHFSDKIENFVEEDKTGTIDKSSLNLPTEYWEAFKSEPNLIALDKSLGD